MTNTTETLRCTTREGSPDDVARPTTFPTQRQRSVWVAMKSARGVAGRPRSC